MSDSLTIDGQLADAAKRGDLSSLTALLDSHPGKLGARTAPYGFTLLHHAAQGGALPVVELLLARGLDVNAREAGDNTYPMHWAAAGGHLEIVRRLADAGGDVVGRGDDHELEVIGWATCWDGCDDDAHRAVVDFLVSRGASHHIFSAVAMNIGDEVRRIVASLPGALEKRMSRNESHQQPLHFAVRMNRPEMVALLLELGADPTAADGAGMPVSVYAAAPNVSQRVIELLFDHGAIDLFGALALGDFSTAGRLVEENPELLRAGATAEGTLHLLVKRGDRPAVQWLLEHGADPNAPWDHWDATVTPLHLAAFSADPEIVRLLLEAGADPHIRDSKHGGDARDWAEHFGQSMVVRAIEEHTDGS